MLEKIGQLNSRTLEKMERERGRERDGERAKGKRGNKRASEGIENGPGWVGTDRSGPNAGLAHPFHGLRLDR